MLFKYAPVLIDNKTKATNNSFDNRYSIFIANAYAVKIMDLS